MFTLLLVDSILCIRTVGYQAFAYKFPSDHFDQKVEESLRRDLPIITTPHAKDHLTAKGEESFSQVFDLDFFESMMVHLGSKSSSNRAPKIKVTGTPGKHVPDGIIGAANDLVGAVRL